MRCIFMQKLLSFMSKTLIGFTLFLSVFFSHAHYVLAGEITNGNDTLTRQKQGVASQHTINFRLASGFDFDASGGKDVLAIQFPTTFSSSGTWTTGDVTFWQDQTGSSASTLTQVTIAQVVSGAGTSTGSLTCDQNNQVGIAIDTTNFIFRIQPCTTTYAASDTGGTNIGAMRLIILNDGANGELTNPASAANSVSVAIFHDDEGVSKKHSSEFRLSIVSDDQTSATSTINPTFTFALNTSTTLAACPSTSQASEGTISFSNPLVFGLINVSQTYICTYTFTNSGNSTKATVFASSANASLTVSSYRIPDVAYTSNSSLSLSAGTENYGICVVSNGGNSNATAVSPFNGTCTTSVDDTSAGALTTGLATIWNTSSNTAYANILVKLTLSPNTEAGIYTDTLYMVAAGTF